MGSSNSGMAAHMARMRRLAADRRAAAARRARAQRARAQRAAQQRAAAQWAAAQRAEAQRIAAQRAAAQRAEAQRRAVAAAAYAAAVQRAAAQRAAADRIYWKTRKIDTAYCMPMSSDGLNNALYQGKWSANKEKISSSLSSRRCVNPRGYDIGGSLRKGPAGGDGCIISNTRAGCLSTCNSAGVSNCSSPELPQIEKCIQGQTIQGEREGKSWSTCKKCITGYIRSEDQRTCKATPITGCAKRAPTNGFTCLGCNPGYRLTNNTCQVIDIPSCVDQGTPKEPRCISCAYGYNKSSDEISCVPQPIEQCKTQNGITCSECNTGYHYNKPPPTQNRCLITPIKYCVDQRKISCHKCQTKWVPSADRRTCKAIPPIRWCQVQRGNVCETCVKGYTQSNGSCMKDAALERGVPGKIGNRGGIGPIGARGAQGYIGPIGRPASIGDLGWRGSQGSQGNLGMDGPEGNRGPTGAQGHRGGIGVQGSTTITDPWSNQGIVNALKGIHKKIGLKNKEYATRKNPPINLNIKMGHLGDGNIKSVYRSTETLGDLNPARDTRENLSMLKEFNSYNYI